MRTRSLTGGLMVGALLLLPLTGCLPGQGGAGDRAVRDITGLMPELRLTMTDHRGRPVTAEDFRGRVTLLYFGYTHCPDVCPTTLARVRRALGRLEASGEVRVLFVTVDPARDTRAALERYVGAFGAPFVGLRGTPAQLRDLARRYRVAYSRAEPGPDGAYPVTHSNAVFVFDRQGDARRVALPGADADDLARALRPLLEPPEART